MDPVEEGEAPARRLRCVGCRLAGPLVARSAADAPSPRRGSSLKCKYLTQIRVVAADSGMSFLKCVLPAAGDSARPPRRWLWIPTLRLRDSRDSLAVLRPGLSHRDVTAPSRRAAARSPSLKRRLEHDYGFRVFLRYEDADGDFITLSTQNDYNEMFNSESGTVTVRGCAGGLAPRLPHRSPRPRAPRFMSRRRTQSVGRSRLFRTS